MWENVRDISAVNAELDWNIEIGLGQALHHVFGFVRMLAVNA